MHTAIAQRGVIHCDTLVVSNLLPNRVTCAASLAILPNAEAQNSTPPVFGDRMQAEAAIQQALFGDTDEWETWPKPYVAPVHQQVVITLSASGLVACSDEMLDTTILILTDAQP